MKNYIFNPETLQYEIGGEPKYARKILKTVLIVLGAVLVLLYFWLYLYVFHLELPKTAILRKQHLRMEVKMDLLNRELDNCNRTLTGIEERGDRVYRSIYGLNDPAEGMHMPGFENTLAYRDIALRGANAQTKKLFRRIYDMEVRAFMQGNSLGEVAIVSAHAGEMISCVPAVPPLLPERGSIHLSSSFGGRTDPVHGGYEFHTGQDFSAQSGTPVYCTGDGVVEKAQFKFTGYGNEIVIDHGYGYKTRYAHLSAIEVNEGMKIRRGEKIGAVGRTGKSTGPHLHYEVIYKGNRVNPRSYMDLDMPSEEYQAMLDERKDSSPKDKRLSTSELLKRKEAVR